MQKIRVILSLANQLFWLFATEQLLKEYMGLLLQCHIKFPLYVHGKNAYSYSSPHTSPLVEVIKLLALTVSQEAQTIVTVQLSDKC